MTVSNASITAMLVEALDDAALHGYETVHVNGDGSWTLQGFINADKLAATVSKWFAARHLADKRHREETGEYLEPIPGQVRIKYAPAQPAAPTTVYIVRVPYEEVEGVFLSREQAEAYIYEKGQEDYWISAEWPVGKGSADMRWDEQPKWSRVDAPNAPAPGLSPRTAAEIGHVNGQSHRATLDHAANAVIVTDTPEYRVETRVDYVMRPPSDRCRAFADPNTNLYRFPDEGEGAAPVPISPQRRRGHDNGDDHV